MKKRLVALLLGMIMIVSLATGCSTNEQPVENNAPQAADQATEPAGTTAATEAVDGKLPVDYFAGTEITIAAKKKSSNTAESFNDKLVFKMAEEATGIHVNWIEVESAGASERLSVMLASKEQPDAYMGMMWNEDMIANSSMFYDLSEEGLLETYAPDVLAIIEEVKADTGADMMEMMKLTDGSIRGLPGNSACSPTSDTQGVCIINKVWLDKLGKEIPTTAEELYDVLCAFRDNDMNGNGIQDEIPMTFCNNNSSNLLWYCAGSFGFDGAVAYPYLDVEDGKINSTVDTDEWKAFLEYYNKLRNEGLLDVEGFSQTVEQLNAKVAENKVGVYVAWSAPEATEDMEFVLMPNVQGLDGVAPRHQGANGRISAIMAGFVITKDSKNVEAALHFWNYLHTSVDIMNAAYCGEKDVVWFQESEDYCYDDTSTDEAQANYDYNSMNNFGNPLRPLRAFTGKQGARYEMVEQIRDMMIMAGDDIPSKFVDPLAVEERTFIEADLFDFVNGFAAKAIMDGVTDDSWNEYLDELKSYQYYEWLDWYQRYMDGTI